MNTGSNKGNPSWFIPCHLTYNLKSQRSLHSFIFNLTQHRALFWARYLQNWVQKLPVDLQHFCLQIVQSRFEEPLLLYKQVQCISPACLNLKFNCLTILLLLNNDPLSIFWMYPRHLFIGYKELPHSSSIVQATGILVSSSILAFSFSPSAFLSSFCTLAHPQSLMELLLVWVPGNSTVQGEFLWSRFPQPPILTSDPLFPAWIMHISSTTE